MEPSAPSLTTTVDGPSLARPRARSSPSSKVGVLEGCWSQPRRRAASSGPAKSRSTPDGEAGQHAGRLVRRPERRAIIHVQRHESACCVRNVDGSLDGEQRTGAERRGDSGQVQHTRFGDGGLVQIGRRQLRGGAVAAVVPDPPGRSAAVFLDHHPGGRDGILLGDDPDALGAEFPGDQGAEGVGADPADPGAGHAEPGQPDGDIGFGAADPDRQAGPAVQSLAGCGEQGHGFADGDDRPGSVCGGVPWPWAWCSPHFRWWLIVRLGSGEMDSPPARRIEAGISSAAA